MDKAGYSMKGKMVGTISVFSIAVLVILGGLTRTVSATPIENLIGIESPELTITFSEYTFPTGTAISDQYSSLGVTFCAELFYNIDPFFFPTDFLSNYIPSPYAINNPVSIIFDDVQDSASFALQTYFGRTRFTALLE